MVDMALKFLENTKDWRLFLVCLFSSVKQQNYVILFFQIAKERPTINHICIHVWGQTTPSGMHFQ